jgi:hypothetical protein
MKTTYKGVSKAVPLVLAEVDLRKGTVLEREKVKGLGCGVCREQRREVELLLRCV